METVLKVTGLSKFGFFAEGEEKGIYFERDIPESVRGKFIVGAELPVTLRVTNTGTKYVTGLNENPTPLVAPVFNNMPLAKAEQPKVVVPKTNSETMSKADWNAKDRSMMVGGLSHDSAVLVAAAATANTSVELLLKDYIDILKALIQIRDEIK